MTLCDTVNLNREALKVIRERSGHTKSSLAELAQIDRTLVHRLENGQRKATPAVMSALAVALKVPVTALMGPEGQQGEAA